MSTINQIIQDGITFKHVLDRTVTRKGASIITTADQVTNDKYVYDDWNPVIMGLDIDWNGADLSEVLGSEYSSIQTTGQLLSAIKAAAQIASTASSEENHYTPSQEVTTYQQENKVIESIKVDSKGHIIGVTFAPKVETIETT